MDMTQILDDTQQLIRVKSTADQPDYLHEALDIIRNKLIISGTFSIEEFISDGKPSLLAYASKTRPSRFRVLLNAHIDVVDAQDSQFKPRIISDRLYGRGALDMKTAAIVLTEVFCNLAHKLPYDVGLQIVTDEEVGGAHGTKYQIEQGVAADFVFAGESTPANNICTETRGLCWVDIVFAGKTGHGAYPWDGDNAALRATEYINELLSEYPVPAAKTWATTVNVASINTDNATINRIPDKATISIDIRPIAGDNHFTDKQATMAYLQSLGTQAHIRIREFAPSHVANKNDADVKQLAESIAAHTGESAVFIQKHGASDIRYYSDIKTQAVVYGLPGAGMHGDDEYVDVSSIETYYKVLQDFLLAIK